MENTVASADFGKWIIKHIDRWFAWARQLGLGLTGWRISSWSLGLIAQDLGLMLLFPGGQGDAQTSFGAKVDHPGDIVAINWQFSHELQSRGDVELWP
jgi:hypothetical protein